MERNLSERLHALRQKQRTESYRCETLSGEEQERDAPQTC